MKFKDFLKSNTAFVLYMLLAAIIIGLLLVWLVFFWLSDYTQHGTEYKVPDVCGMYVEEAQLTLQSENLGIQVIDSTYTTRQPFGTIVEQNPPVGSMVKSGRAVYVIVNANSIRMIPLPDLHDISYRQARAALQALNLGVSDVRYEPSEYRDLVLDVRRDGESIDAGTRLAEGTEVELVVGKGKGAEQVYVPNLTGKTLRQARLALLDAGLIVGAVNYDEPEKADSCMIYYQNPQNGRWVMEGTHIDLYLSADPDRAAQMQNNDDEEFF